MRAAGRSYAKHRSYQNAFCGLYRLEDFSFSLLTFFLGSQFKLIGLKSGKLRIQSFKLKA